MTLNEFDQDTATLIPNKIKMELELELSMYSISEWSLVYFDEGKRLTTRLINALFLFLDSGNPGPFLMGLIFRQHEYHIFYLNKSLFRFRYKNEGKVPEKTCQ